MVCGSWLFGWWLSEEGFKFIETFFFEIFDGDKTEGRGVHAIAKAGRRGPVGKHVAEVRLAFGGADFRAGHAQAAVMFFLNGSRIERFGKAGPTGAGFEFVFGTKERLAGDHADVNAVAMIVPVFIPEWRFGAVLFGDLVLERSELHAEFFVGEFWGFG